MAGTGRRAGALGPPELELAAGTRHEIDLDEEEIPLVADQATQRGPAASAAAAATAPSQRTSLLFITLIASLGG